MRMHTRFNEVGAWGDESALRLAMLGDSDVDEAVLASDWLAMRGETVVDDDDDDESKGLRGGLLPKPNSSDTPPRSRCP